jgi:nicotinamidase-related amidase
VHCVQHTRGAELSKSLRRDRIGRVFQKGTDPGIDSYTRLLRQRASQIDGLADYLKAQGADEVSCAGWRRIIA